MRSSLDVVPRKMTAAAALVVMAVMLLAISSWHERATGGRSISSAWLNLVTRRPPDLLLAVTTDDNTAGDDATSPRRRRFLKKDTSTTSIDDDITRDKTCREYLMNFLNGTTDSKDECQGMLTAWKAADCQDDSHINKPLQRKHVLDNGTEVDDNVVIDDFYENWECCESISSYYERHCEQVQLDAMKLFGIVSVLVVCGLAKSALRWAKIPFVPDAGACILVGAIVAGALRITSPDLVKERLTFDNDLFLHILLPPIIFAAAIEIDKHAFRRNFYPIMAFAVFGTAMSAMAIGWITYHLSHLGSGTALPLLDSLVFGALMSSIDPVATLSILAGVGCQRGDVLYTIIFGESLLNDGVSIVLFESLIRHMGASDQVDPATIHDILLHFFSVTTGSIVIGVVFGVVCTFYFWALAGMHTPVTEVALFFAWALLPYYVADGWHYSGIISIMVMGFMVDYFVIGGFVGTDEGGWRAYMARRMSLRPNHPMQPRLNRIKDACSKAFSGDGHLLEESRNRVGFVAEVISSIMETAIFAYLGLFLFTDWNWRPKLLSAGVFACVSSRAFMVVVLCALINAFVWADVERKLGRLWRFFIRRNSFHDEDEDDARVYLDRKAQMILFSAGVRGAVSYALAVNIPVYDPVTKLGSSFKAELKAMTSSAIVLLLFSFGALTYFMLHPATHASPPEEDPLTASLMDRRDTGLASDDGGDAGGDDGYADENLSYEFATEPLARTTSGGTMRSISVGSTESDRQFR